jgi:hypothetical protein
MPDKLPDAAKVVRAVFRALSDREWEAVVDRVRPAALRSFRQFELTFIRASLRNLPRTAEQIAEDLGAPPAVAEWFAQGEANQAAAERKWTPGVFGADSFEELRALDARLFFIRWLAATYEGSVPWQAFGGSGRKLRRKVLGSVVESGGWRTRAHVVYREQDDPEFSSRVEVTTLVHDPDRGWMIEADVRLLAPSHEDE